MYLRCLSTISLGVGMSDLQLLVCCHYYVMSQPHLPGASPAFTAEYEHCCLADYYKWLFIVIYFYLKLQYISVATTMLSYKRPPAYVDTENLFSQLQDDMLITLITSTL